MKRPETRTTLAAWTTLVKESTRMTTSTPGKTWTYLCSVDGLDQPDLNRKEDYKRHDEPFACSASSCPCARLICAQSACENQVKTVGLRSVVCFTQICRTNYTSSQASRDAGLKYLTKKYLARSDVSMPRCRSYLMNMQRDFGAICIVTGNAMFKITNVKRGMSNSKGREYTDYLRDWVVLMLTPVL